MAQVNPASLAEDLKSLRQRSGYRLSKLRTLEAILGLPLVKGAGATVDDRLGAAEALILQAVGSLPRVDREIAEAMLGLGERAGETLDARLRSLGGSLETARDHMAEVTTELAHQLYKLGHPGSSPRDTNQEEQEQSPQVRITVPSDKAVFITFADVDGYDIRFLSDALRSAEIEVIAFPLEAKDKGARLVDNITRHLSPLKVLLIAISPEAMRDDDFASLLPDVLLPQVLPKVNSTIVVDLRPRRRPALPAYLRSFRVIQASDVVEELTGRREPQLPASPTTPYSTVSGAFEPSRPQSDMFVELKNQIYIQRRLENKYLYWDVRAASRWQTIASSSQYLTAQLGTNVLLRHADAIMSLVLDEGDATSVSFINFGVGTGVKDRLILDALLNQCLDRDASAKIAYFPVDESLSMIQITIQSLQDLLSRYRDNLDTHFVLDDFARLGRLAPHIEEIEGDLFEGRSFSRLLALLGGSIGNFREGDILSKIKPLMRARDFLLLGVEFVAGRTEKTLRANYEDDHMREFLAGPIADIEGSPPDYDNFRFQIVKKSESDEYSDVPDAWTVVGKLKHAGGWIELFYSHKYEQQQLEDFLDQQGFNIALRVLSDQTPPQVGKYLLTLR